MRRPSPEDTLAATRGDDQPQRTIAVLDTDPGVRWALERGLARSGYDVFTLSTAGEALKAAFDGIDAVVMELLPEAGLNLDLLTNILETPGQPRVVCVSIDSNPQTVIECIRRGASDFLPKPFSLAEVRTALSRALASEQDQRMMRRPDKAAKSAPSDSMLIGISPAMQELRTTIQQVARTDLNCLIRGESGTGKDMVAREIHRLSGRNGRPFVKVNCTALPEQLLESELFGYEKGAFTGAGAAKPGRFELANRGIIFLDEIGDMQPSLQAKLLQVIEHKEFTKLGGRRSIKVDVQIIAATNADLESHTKQGYFRDDLYFRLNEVCIWVPSLKDRKEDIPLMVRHFIQKHGRFASESALDISGDELAALTNHDWPGNVRELESTIKRWLALGQKVLPASRQKIQEIQARPLNAPTVATPSIPAPPAEVLKPPPPPEPEEQSSSSPKKRQASRKKRAKRTPSTNSCTPEEVERIRKALEECQWNRSKAAKLLGINYQTLRRRIKLAGLAEDKP
jgi:DNA-binding NtrC family response regulator